MNSKFSISVKDIRAIKEAEVELNGITVLSGVNGCGKTTIAKLLFGFIKTSLNFDTVISDLYTDELSFAASFLRDFVPTDKNKFLNSVGIFITFISALIFRRDYIMEVGNFEQYYDMLLPQSMIAVETMRHEGKYVVITQRSMGVSCTQSVPYDLYKVWLEEYSNVLLKAAVAAGLPDHLYL